MAHVTGRRAYLIEAELDQGVHAELLLQLIQVLLPRAVARQLDDLPAAVHLPPRLEGLPHIRPRRQPGLETHHIWLGALHACLLHAEPMARTLILIPAPLRLKPSPHGIPHMVLCWQPCLHIAGAPAMRAAQVQGVHMPAPVYMDCCPHSCLVAKPSVMNALRGAAVPAKPRAQGLCMVSWQAESLLTSSGLPQ